MSDENKPKRTRSPINALKLLNALRAEKGLPKIGARVPKPPRVKVSKEQKQELFINVMNDLFPEALTSAKFEFTERSQRLAITEYEKRLKAITGETVPYTGKPRGRKPKVV